MCFEKTKNILKVRIRNLKIEKSLKGRENYKEKVN